MVTMTVYSSAGDFNLAAYFNVDTRITYGSAQYYTNTDLYGASLYSTDFILGEHGPSPLFFGQATTSYDGTPGFAPDGAIKGRIGGEKLSAWLIHQDLDSFTPDSLMRRIFVGDDTVIGNTGNDLLDGHAGADRLRGRMGDDTLIGGVGDDVLVGGFGTDTLTGGFGADTFVYRQRHDLQGGREVITDFSHADGDKIDLRPFDAVLKTDSERRISFIGEAQFNAAGVAEVRVQVVSDTLNVLQFDTDGNGRIDAVLNVYTKSVLGFDDVLTGLSPENPKVDAAAFGHDAAAVSAHLFQAHQPELAQGVLA